MTARPQVELPEVQPIAWMMTCDQYRRPPEFSREKPTGVPPICKVVALVSMDDYAALTTRLAESEARAVADARDAARYRALRELLCRVGARLVSFSGATPDSIDAAIDAAQEAEREAGSA